MQRNKHARAMHREKAISWEQAAPQGAPKMGFSPDPFNPALSRVPRNKETRV